MTRVFGSQCFANGGFAGDISEGFAAGRIVINNSFSGDRWNTHYALTLRHKRGHF